MNMTEPLRAAPSAGESRSTLKLLGTTTCWTRGLAVGDNVGVGVGVGVGGIGVDVATRAVAVAGSLSRSAMGAGELRVETKT